MATTAVTGDTCTTHTVHDPTCPGCIAATRHHGRMARRPLADVHPDPRHSGPTTAPTPLTGARGTPHTTPAPPAPQRPTHDDLAPPCGHGMPGGDRCNSVGVEKCPKCRNGDPPDTPPPGTTRTTAIHQMRQTIHTVRTQNHGRGMLKHG